jgi:hypothetical protein
MSEWICTDCQKDVDSCTCELDECEMCGSDLDDSDGCVNPDCISHDSDEDDE